jgi:hypothetical protein
MFFKRIFLSCLLVLGLVVLEGSLVENFEQEGSLIKKVTTHSTYFRMGDFRYFPNDVVKYEVRPMFYFCGEFCPVKVVTPFLQKEKGSFIKIKTK